MIVGCFDMNKTEGALLLVMATFLVWVYACIAQPFMAFIISCVGFAILLGVILFALVSFLYVRRHS